MKTINGFFETENNYQMLTLNEMITVKGGENPPAGEDDPFKKKTKKE